MANYNIKIAHYKSINIKSKKVRKQLKPILTAVSKRNKPVKKVKKGQTTNYATALDRSAKRLMKRMNFAAKVTGRNKRTTKEHAKEMILDMMKYYEIPTEAEAVTHLTNILGISRTENQARAIINNMKDKTAGTIKDFKKWLKLNKKPELTMAQNFGLWRAGVRNDKGQQLIKILLDTGAVTFTDKGNLHWVLRVDDIMFDSALYMELYALLQSDNMLRVDYVFGSGK